MQRADRGVRCDALGGLRERRSGGHDPGHLLPISRCCSRTAAAPSATSQCCGINRGCSRRWPPRRLPGVSWTRSTRRHWIGSGRLARWRDSSCGPNAATPSDPSRGIAAVAEPGRVCGGPGHISTMSPAGPPAPTAAALTAQVCVVPCPGFEPATTLARGPRHRSPVTRRWITTTSCGNAAAGGPDRAQVSGHGLRVAG